MRTLRRLAARRLPLPERSDVLLLAGALSMTAGLYLLVGLALTLLIAGGLVAGYGALDDLRPRPRARA